MSDLGKKSLTAALFLILSYATSLQAENRKYTVITDPKTQEQTKKYWNGEKTYKHADGRKDVSNYKDGWLHGLATFTRADGKKKWTKEYKNGKLHGFYKRYNLKGKIETSTQYAEGVEHGEFRLYFGNGKLKRKETKNKGKLHGIQYNYGPYEKDAGKLFNTENYVNGEKSGEQKSFFPDGSVRAIGNYKIDKSGRSQRHGKFISYHSNKKPNLISHYVNGSQHGLNQKFYVNGNLASETCYKEGRAQDSLAGCKGASAGVGSSAANIRKKNYSNGKPKIEYQTKEGQYHGFVKKYAEDGWLKSVENFQNGKRDGLSTLYFMNKKPKQISHYKNNRLHGTHKIFFGNGKLRESGKYNNGKREGLSQVYNKEGLLTNETLYKNGKRDGISKIYKNKKLVKKNIYKDGYIASSKEWDEKGKLKSSKEYYKDGSEK